MIMPNLFSFAPNELTQDALLLVCNILGTCD